MPHCAWKSFARQSKYLFIASEISTKLFLSLTSTSFLPFTGDTALKMCRFARAVHQNFRRESPIRKRRVSMAKMKVALVPKPGADFEIVEREIPNPTAGHVRIRVQACGICHSDSLVKEGYWPGIQYPRAPGHEVAGVIDDVGSGVTGWKKGQRVGVGCPAGQDGTCRPCPRG